MREFKFRAWIKKEKHMVYIPQYSISSFYGWHDKKTIIMQYTGFKIKNREVYEGDIIKGRKDTVYKVIFKRGCFFLYHLNLFNPDKTNLRWGLLSRLFDSDMIDIEIDCEVIGNIYQNKDLLKEGI